MAFAADYGAKWPKAAAKITEDLDVLLAYFDYPAENADASSCHCSVSRVIVLIEAHDSF